jgi:hypothetical protein
MSDANYFESGETGRHCDASRGDKPVAEACDLCGATALVERKCKVICMNCGSILRTCADLA